jgi:ABC-type glycerol-3-phosphate transport system substrate-binding protein
MKSAQKRAAIALVGVLSVAGTLTACGSSEEPAAEPTGPVTIEVAIDAGLEPEAISAFEERILQFEEVNPDIQVATKEFTWSGTTFAAELAGGTLPDVFPIPFTDGRALIEREQIADISELVAELPYADQFNPTIAEAGQDTDGGMWAVPISAYNQGLHYNRALFEEAGLDPDNPPATWDEVREAAKVIADKTGQAGYAHMTQSNTGGWILTTETYALGGRVVEGEGEGATATVDNDATAQALEMLREMRWEDNSMGASFLYDWSTINQDFAAGKIGMYVSGGANYPNLFTQNQMNPDEYGVTVLPLEGDDAGTLGGVRGGAGGSGEVDRLLLHLQADRPGGGRRRGRDRRQDRPARRRAGPADLRPGDLRAAAELDQGSCQRPAGELRAHDGADVRPAGHPRALRRHPGGVRGARPGGPGGADGRERGHRRAPR